MARFNLSRLTAGTLAFAFSTSFAGAVMVQNGDFNEALSNDSAVNESDAGAGWRVPWSGAWFQDDDVNGHSAVTHSVTDDPSSYFQASFLQVIADDNITNIGLHTLSFDVINTDTWSDDDQGSGGYNALNVSVYGVNDSFDSNFTTGGNVADNAVLLGGIDVLGSMDANGAVSASSANSFGWTSFSTDDVDLGTGYDYLVVRASGKINSGADSYSSGELMALDNISLAPVPEPATLTLAACSLGLLMTRRRV